MHITLYDFLFQTSPENEKVELQKIRPQFFR